MPTTKSLLLVLTALAFGAQGQELVLLADRTSFDAPESSCRCVSSPLELPGHRHKSS